MIDGNGRRYSIVAEVYNLGNRIVNNYLLRIDDWYLLIDTGYDNGFARFRKRLNRLGIQPKDIRYVFLTHAHDDHAGFLNDVLDICNAKVILHPKAIAGLKRGQNSFKGGCSSLLAYCFCRLMGMAGKGEHKFPRIKDEYLERMITTDSLEFRQLSFPFQVIETPGHTADHISLLKDGILFCGDAAMNNFPSIKRTIIWIENLEQYRGSWNTMIKLAPEMVYPGHGKPFPLHDLKKHYGHLSNIRLYPLKQKEI